MRAMCNTVCDSRVAESALLDNFIRFFHNYTGSPLVPLS